MSKNKNKFICPDCGSESVKENFHYKSKREDSLYATISHEIQCGSCYIDIPGHLGERQNNISLKVAKEEWIQNYKPEHLKHAPRCAICNLFYFEIEKKLEQVLDNNKNIFMQKFTQNGNPDLICKICEPDNFK